MRLGLSLHPARSVDAILDEAHQADQQGFDSVWMNDHMLATLGGMYGRPMNSADTRPPDYPLDGFTVMAAIGATTSRVRLAWGMLNPSFRSPAVLAKMLATLDLISHGRVICSVGAGFLKEEHLAFGAPFFDDHDERSEHQGEVLQLIKQLWLHPAPERVDFDGRYVQAHGIQFAPAPAQRPHPPIWVGGDSDATVRLAKRLADGWIMRSHAALPALMAAPDWPTRPMTLVTTAHMFVAPTKRQAQQEAAEFHLAESRKVGPPLGSLEDFLNAQPIGTPDDCVRKVREIESYGINYLRIVCSDATHQERVAQMVLPIVHGLD